MRLAFDNHRAFRPMQDMLAWRQDRAPHKQGSFRAVVLEGESDSQSAGSSLDGVTANPWTVIVPLAVALIADIAVGDTLTTVYGVDLTVQQISKSETDWVIRCTSNMRAPNG